MLAVFAGLDAWVCVGTVADQVSHALLHRRSLVACAHTPTRKVKGAATVERRHYWVLPGLAKGAGTG